MLDEETRQKIACVFDDETPMSFYMQTSLIMGLLTCENVNEVLARVYNIDRDFMDDFVPFAREAYAGSDAQRLTIKGPPLPDESFKAIKQWLKQYDKGFWGRSGSPLWMRIKTFFGWQRKERRR